MQNNIKSREIPLPLENGETVNLTLNFSKLMSVRSKKKEVYKRYNKIMMDGPQEVFDNTLILYVAYLCGLEDLDTAMSEHDFIQLLPPYMQMVNEIVIDLTRPKKQRDSDSLSETQQGDPENQNM